MKRPIFQTLLYLIVVERLQTISVRRIQEETRRLLINTHYNLTEYAGDCNSVIVPRISTFSPIGHWYQFRITFLRLFAICRNSKNDTLINYGFIIRTWQIGVLSLSTVSDRTYPAAYSGNFGINNSWKPKYF